MVWLYEQFKSDTWKGLFPKTQNGVFDWLSSKNVVEEYEMICDWLANRECLFTRKSLIKVNILRVWWKKRSVVHTEDKRIRKEISLRTKFSPAKVSLSEKIELDRRLHKPDTSFVCFSNTTKINNFYLSIYLSIYVVYIIVTPLCFNKLLLILNEEFFLSFNGQYPCSNTWSKEPPWSSEEVSDRLCNLPYVVLSNTAWALRELINQVSGNICLQSRN